MTSSTTRRSGCRNQGDTSEARPSDLEPRRQLAVQRSLDGAPIAGICHEMGCSKRWLSTWRDRYQAGDPTWAQEGSRRPTTSPAKRSATREEHIVHFLQTAVSTGAGPASAAALRQALKDTGVEPIPSRRTIYRGLQRQEKEVTPPLSMPSTRRSPEPFYPVTDPVTYPTERYYAAIENRVSVSQWPCM